jgi:hypothetical protein
MIVGKDSLEQIVGSLFIPNVAAKRPLSLRYPQSA